MSLARDLLPLPSNADELERCLSDPVWRLNSGCLYMIKVKGDEVLHQGGGYPDSGGTPSLSSPSQNSHAQNFESELLLPFPVEQGGIQDDERELGAFPIAQSDEELIAQMMTADEPSSSFILPFKPNEAQLRFMKRLWTRNLILKARQLGFTTLIAILWLDHALFNANQNCGIIAQDLDTVFEIFRDKIKLAYDNLPQEIRERFPLAVENNSTFEFAHNGSKIRVATSFRGGTIHRLHVSEFGKICARYPLKAYEVVTGSFPAVPTNGILVIESTAEGREGHFYQMAQRAQQDYASRKKLTMKDYRFHFYAWWQEAKYRIDNTLVHISEFDHKYFDRIEQEVQQKMNVKMKLDPDQRAWYVVTRDNDLVGDQAKMWQEYPSHPDEAFQVATDGNYYGEDMLKLRGRGGICQVEVLDVSVNTFWDIGASDGCAIWFHQMMNQQDRFIGYYEEHNQNLQHYAAEIARHPYIYHTHFLPHDAAHQRLGDFNKSVLNQLQELLPSHNFVIVPRITQLMTGIQHTRKHLKNAWFDEKACAHGISRLDGYTKKFSATEKRFLDLPNKSNGCSEGADALRQWAQAKEIGMLGDYVYSANRDSAINGASSNTYGYEPAPPQDWRM